jgi:cellulose synthase/poly-beta-1,6-N-acetylglucosamine synthase-like glycosyltransferase
MSYLHKVAHTSQQYDSANWILLSSEEQILLSRISNCGFYQLVMKMFFFVFIYTYLFIYLFIINCTMTYKTQIKNPYLTQKKSCLGQITFVKQLSFLCPHHEAL